MSTIEARVKTIIAEQLDVKMEDASDLHLPNILCNIDRTFVDKK